jgi:hypothetical protein
MLRLALFLILASPLQAQSIGIVTGKLLAAAEAAHDAHTEAVKECRRGKAAPLTPNWSGVEKYIRELPNLSFDEFPKILITRQTTLEKVRDTLNSDLVACAVSQRSLTFTTVTDALISLKDATADLDSIILDRGTSLAFTAKQYEKLSQQCGKGR